MDAYSLLDPFWVPAFRVLVLKPSFLVPCFGTRFHYAKLAKILVLSRQGFRHFCVTKPKLKSDGATEHLCAVDSEFSSECSHGRQLIGSEPAVRNALFCHLLRNTH